MKIIKPSHQRIKHDCTPLEFIERIGRTCYKSTDKITDGSAAKFVHNLMERGHWAMMEHETVYLCMSVSTYCMLKAEMEVVHADSRFFNVTMPEDADLGLVAMSGNLRAFYNLLETSANSDSMTEVAMIWLATLLSNAYPEVFEKFTDDTMASDYIPAIPIILMSRNDFIDAFAGDNNTLRAHVTHTALFTCDRGVSHELVRHRPVSFAQESTRYCNYSQDKFGKEITVIEPFFYKDKEDSEQYNFWKLAMEDSEKYYFKLLELGSTPQEARSVLPNSLKTEIIMTATEEEWQHIVNLRAKGTTGKPHPQMVEIMEPWYEELKIITDGRIS